MDTSLNNILNMNFFVRRAMDDVMPLNWVLSRRVIFDYEILYIMDGEAEITVDRTVYDAKPGDIFFFRPLRPHMIRAVGPVRLRQPHIHFDFFYDNNSEKVYIPVWPMTDPKEDIVLARKDIITPQFNIPDKIVSRFSLTAEKLLFGVIREHQSPDAASQLRKKALMCELIALLLETDKKDENPASLPVSVVSSIRAMIENKYTEPFDNDALAAEAGYSKNYFVHLYKAATGQTPKEYYEEFRFVKAQTYLVQSNISVTEAADNLGFDTIHDFSRFFKRKSGMSPTEFRKQYEHNEK